MKWNTPKELLSQEYVENELEIDDFITTTRLVRKLENIVNRKIGAIDYVEFEAQPKDDGGIYSKHFILHELKNCKLISDTCTVSCSLNIDFRDLMEDQPPYCYITVVVIKENGEWLFKEQWFRADYDVLNNKIDDLYLESI